MPQSLNSKDQAAFRQLVKHYEAKQYKKAIKTADQLLRKNANHGETEAMKALTLNAQGNSDDAFSLGKVALQHDMKSHICWHVYGLLYRSAKNLEEAIKAYKFALRLEPESAQILRDLAFLQIQMRDYQGYIQSRKAMLQARPAIRQNWTALAVAYHLAGELHTAEEMLKTYEGTLKSPPSRLDYENSDAVLYRNSIIEEMGDTERALEHVDTIFKENLDRTAVMEARARHLLKLGRKDEAEKAYRALLERNNEYRHYYERLEEALGLDRSKSEDLPKLSELYRSFADTNERLDAARRIPLDFLKGDNFEMAADAYLTRMLKKGVPSTFANLKALYTDEEKRSIIPKLVEGYLSKAPWKNPKNDAKQDDGKADRFHESCLYFLAQHYDYYVTRDLSKALKYIDQAIMMSPKSVDYHHIKGRIAKHSGNISKAAEILEQARKLDERDRYINTKCAKYQLRSNENDLAIKTMSKFTRNEAAGGALGDLHDMQCMWYITEDGEAFLRRGKLGLALKRFRAVYDIFETWHDDQFDFHQFSLRKGQVRAYIDMIRWEDNLREHPFFTRASLAAVRIYLSLYDNPDLAHSSGMNGSVKLDGLDANERKKALKKIKKEQEKQDKIEAEKKEAERKTQKKGLDGDVKKEDNDPNGHKLVETKTPLDDAMLFVSFMLEFSPKNIDAQVVGFEVFLRKQKYLLALKCLQAAHTIDPEHPLLHEQLGRFRLALDSYKPSDPKITTVLKSCSEFVPTSSGLKSSNDSFLKKHHSSPRHVVSGLRVRASLDAASKAQNEKELIKVLALPGVTLSDVDLGQSVLKEWKSSDEVVRQLKEQSRQKWPEANAFAER